MGAIGGVCFSSGRLENDPTISNHSAWSIIPDSQIHRVLQSCFSILCFLHATLALRHSWNVLFSAYIVISHWGTLSWVSSTSQRWCLGRQKVTKKPLPSSYPEQLFFAPWRWCFYPWWITWGWVSCATCTNCPISWTNSDCKMLSASVAPTIIVIQRQVKNSFVIANLCIRPWLICILRARD